MLVASALVLVTKVIYSGIVGFVPSKKDPHLVRVVVPNGRVPNEFESTREIPSHVAYVMFDIKDLAPGSRQPDFTYTFKKPSPRTLGVVLIEGEYLRVGGSFVRTALDFDPKPSPLMAAKPTNETQDSMHWMFDHRFANPAIPLDLRVLGNRPDPDKVTLRMDLRNGHFAIEPKSMSAKVFTVTPTRCQALARGISVTLPTKSDAKRQTLTLTSTPFRGESTRPPLRLSRAVSDGDLLVVIGNEPVSEVEASASLLGATIDSPTMDIHSTKLVPHMLIMDRLLKAHQGVIFTPFVIPDDKCSADGVIKPINPDHPEGDTGTSGGCAPFVIIVADPTHR